ncbi:ESX secretion-associated protein EspG [Nocardia sp. NPDC049707]|uniref:ESX secretion-associated protein EspG n=1 Tax=Nocardia sp. NPDC049707 TaxID=3154735 RepID=UPI00341A169C
MNRTWKLTDLEFVVAWEDILREGFIPQPFVFTSRTELWNDYVRERIGVREQLVATMDNDLLELLKAMARPDIRVIAAAWDGADPQNTEKCVRVVAARRGDLGVVATQIRGETVLHSGGYTFTECDPLALADELVAILPDAAAGQRGEIELATHTDAAHLDYERQVSAVFDDFDDTVSYRSEAFSKAPVETAGQVIVVQGQSKFGPRGIVENRIPWRDLVDDGRYAIVSANPPVARPVDKRQFVAVINTQIATVVRAIKDERV